LPSRKTGELVVEWTVDASEWQPVAYVQKGTDKADGWFAAALAAPNVDDNKVAAKDVTIVIDRSGSMTGDAMEHARVAAANMIKRLDARDRINIISFSDEVDPLFSAPQTLDADTRKRAVEFAERLRPGGGTDIALALRTAISSQDRKESRPRVVIFMTDGQSEAEQALEAAKSDTGDTRVFTLGLGKEVNRPLLQRIAAVKRGRFVYVDSPQSLDAEVGKLAASIAKPVLVNVSVDVQGAQGVRVYPRTIPDLFAMDELLVTGQLKGSGTAKIVFKGTLDGKQVSFSRSVDIAKAPARPWVGRLWAHARIDHLQEELALKTGDTAELKTELLDLALAYNVVTPYTAFLAIPESELGEMRGTLEAARARKAKIIADNADVAALKEANQAAGPLNDPSYGATAAPDPMPAPEREMASVDEDYDTDGTADDEESEGGPSPLRAERQVKGRGCAGCATQSTDRAGLLLLLAIVALVLRRRRR
jgi:Ca-activated chloride channel family protein